jgi:hypothetical protein
MLNHCANPGCGKPLHYLREGRVYVFDVTRYATNAEDRTRRMEHFWLCGACSNQFLLEQTANDGVRISPREMREPGRAAETAIYEAPRSIAS